MSEPRQLLRRILGPAGADAGCDHSGELLDQFVEAELAGRAAAELFPEVAAHLEGCPDCREDHDGLRALAGSAPSEGPAASG